jgi:ribonuclease HI
MPLDPHALHVYVDGSCLSNPGGKGGAAAFVEYPDHLNQGIEQIVDFGCNESSNNRMELLACIKALEWLRQNHSILRIGRAQIVTDSQYVRENIFRAVGWQRNGWRNLHGEEKQNSDLWKQLLSLKAKVGMRVDFQQQTGKSSPILKLVDKAAKAAAMRGGLVGDVGFRTGKVSPSKTKKVATIFPAQGKTVIIHIYRKSSALQDNQIRFHLYDETSRAYTDSYYAYASDSLTLELHRQHLYRVRFNSNPRNPVIEEIIEEVVRF